MLLWKLTAGAKCSKNCFELPVSSSEARFDTFRSAGYAWQTCRVGVLSLNIFIGARGVAPWFGIELLGWLSQNFSGQGLGLKKEIITNTVISVILGLILR